MPKFARPNSYTGKQSNQSWSGQTRAANSVEAAAGDDTQLYISPATLSAASEALVDAALLAPGPIGSTTPNTINGTVITAQTRLEVNGGAVTDSIGSTTLVAGVATVLNTNIAATDRVIAFRIAPGASTALGLLSYVITAGVSFVVTSQKPADATTETGDVSSIGYLIIRQV